MSDDHTRRGNDTSERQVRLARVRDMLLADLAAGRIRIKSAYVYPLIEEFKIARRTGYDDFEEVWRELRKSTDDEILKKQQDIMLKLDGYLDELWDLYEACRTDGDLKTALATMREIGRACDLLAPDKLHVTVGPSLDVDRLGLDEKRALLDAVRKARVDPN